MKILQIVPGFNYGGAENHVVDLANALDNMGQEVFIISSHGRQTERLNSGIRFINYKISDIRIPVNIIWLCRFLKQNQIDVIHAHKRLSIFVASLAGAIMRIPVVVTVHGKLKYDLRTFVTRRLPASIIFVSSRSIGDFRVYNQIKHKFEFIQNGVDIIPNNFIRNLSSITYMSRIDSKHSEVILKVIDEVLPELLKDFPSVLFNVIGDGNGMTQVTEAARKLNESTGHEVVKLHGFLSDVHPEIRSSGLVLGVGRVAIEALASCVPVLSIKSGLMGEIVTTANYRFYQLNNFVATGYSAPEGGKLSEMIRNYLADPDKYQSETLLLNKNIFEDFSMKKVAEATINLYHKVLKRET